MGAVRGFSGFNGMIPVFWLIARVALGWYWLDAGLDKLGQAVWTGDKAGTAVGGFLNGAIEKSQTGAHPEVSGWFATLTNDVFLPNADIMSYLVVAGEIMVGAALIAGVLTKFSALAGLVMNLAYLLAGTTSANAFMALLSVGILAAPQPGKVGVDYYLLPALRRIQLRVLGEERMAHARNAVALTAAVFLLGFITYVLLENTTTFVAIWASAIPFGVAWLFVAPRMSKYAGNKFRLASPRAGSLVAR